MVVGDQIIWRIVAPLGAPTCVGSNGMPTLSATGRAQLGGSYTIDLTNGPVAGLASLFVGLSDQAWGALPLPFDLVLLGGGTGCSLVTSGEIQVAMLTSASGTASQVIPLPLIPDLVGELLFHSWVIADLAAPNNRLGVTTSNGAIVTYGF